MTDFGGPEVFIPIYILTGFYWLILTPLSLFYIYELWQLASYNIPFFTKRHPKLIVICGIINTIYPTILRPIADLTRAHGLFHYNHLLPRTLNNIVQWCMLLEYMRLWLLYYDYQYSLHTLALKWKQQILKEKTNIPWTHRHRCLGNVKILSVISGVFGAIIILIIILTELWSTANVNIVESIPMICMIFFLVFAFKVRKCRDEFMIQKEFKIYGMMLLAAIVTYVIIQMVSTAASNWRIMLMNMFTCTACYTMSFVSTHWVIKQYNTQRKKLELCTQLLLSNSASVMNEVKSRLTLTEVVSTKDGFDSFANHLVREFAIENLFFVFEVVQIKNELVSNRLIDVGNIGVTIAIDFHRMERLRRKESSIHTVEEMKTNIEYIVQQYVLMEGEYTVNISSTTRNRLMCEYERLEHDYVSDGTGLQAEKEKAIVREYIGIFDESMEEIISLMRGDSLTRFYQTAEYKMLIGNN
eukprot:177098_1